MFSRYLLCLLFLLLCGCGAKTVAPELSTHINKIKLSKGEGVVIILDEYSYDGKYEDELSERIAKHIKMQQEIQKCFAKAAKKSGLIVNSPISLLHDPFLDGHGSHQNIRRGNEPQSEQKGPNDLQGMRYLVSTKIDTFYSGDTDFAVDGDEYVLILGAAKTGTKSTKANLTIHDIQTGDQVDSLWIESSGRQGWTAGVAVLYILPVPWYWPWWSMTETETCTAIGETVVSLVSPLKGNGLSKDEMSHKPGVSEDIEVPSIVDTQVVKPMSEKSLLNPGDIASLQFKDGSSKIITITAIDEKTIAGYYDVYEGADQVSEVWGWDSITTTKHVNLSKKTTPELPKEQKPEDLFKNGDIILLEFKNGNTIEIILTHMNDKVIAGHYQYTRGKTTPVNYAVSDVRRINYATKDINKSYHYTNY